MNSGESAGIFRGSEGYISELSKACADLRAALAQLEDERRRTDVMNRNVYHEELDQEAIRLEGRLADMLDLIRDTELENQEAAKSAVQLQRDHEREMAIIANETARENRLAAEAAATAAAKIAAKIEAEATATAQEQEQASQSIDSLLKGLQGNGEG